MQQDEKPVIVFEFSIDRLYRLQFDEQFTRYRNALTASSTATEVIEKLTRD